MEIKTFFAILLIILTVAVSFMVCVDLVYKLENNARQYNSMTFYNNSCWYNGNIPELANICIDYMKQIK